MLVFTTRLRVSLQYCETNVLIAVFYSRRMCILKEINKDATALDVIRVKARNAGFAAQVW